MQVDSSRQDLLQLARGHAGQRDAVVMAEIDHCIAMRIGGDQRLQFLDCLRVGEVIKFNRVMLRIKVRNCVGANTRCEHEVVVAGPADRHRNSLVQILGGVLGVSDADIIGLGQRLAGRKIDLIVAE